MLKPKVKEKSLNVSSLNQVNLSYFFSVSILALFSVFLVVAAPFFTSSPSLQQPEQFIVTEGSLCQVPPVPPNPRAATGSLAGQVNLYWDRVSGADYYNIAYGPSSLNYQWGSPNVGNTDTYTVASLTPGMPYYFIIAAVNSCGSSGALQEVAAYAGGQAAVEKGYVPPPPASYLPVKPSLAPSPTVLPTVEPTIAPLVLASPIEEATSSSEATPAATLKPVLTTSPSPKVVVEPQSSKTMEKILEYLNLSKWPLLLIILFIVLALVGKKLAKENKDTNYEKQQAAVKPDKPVKPLNVKVKKHKVPVLIATEKGKTVVQKESSVLNTPPRETVKSEKKEKK
ncbi:fibronectin type III domain-containing protein [Patescibacteria group bacterium]